MANTYSEGDYPLKNETYEIIGVCMEVHKFLGRGFSEVVYKDAIEYEFKLRNIFYEREREYSIKYKDTVLAHKYYADFVVMGNIILEVKAQNGALDAHYKQVINYLAVSKCFIGLIVNFGEDSLKYKRVILG